ncbi:MAG: spore coat protein U domain-containing protein [Beijerinckiaceae bacterium]|nr:spore coat protein U domain-containing protein [Beijerinckiaceae bacterium]MCZ8301142.1 spore coat protein U domain-containing protein [Beijerinckiaceae bacterium]
MRRQVYGILILFTLALSGAAQAQTCTITRPATINFGTVDVLLNAAVDVTATISVSCTGTANRTVRVCLNVEDPNTGTVGGVRRALSGTNLLTYQFYSDPGRTVKWSSWKSGGAGVEVLVPLNAAGNSTPVAVTMYGRVFAGQQTAPPGTYAANFNGTFTHQRSRYTTTGQLCPAMTQGTLAWAFAMSATVPAKCVVTSATMNFGNPTALTANIDASTNLGVACSTALPYQVQLNGGLSGATNPTLRRMTKGAEFVTYGLYRDAARTQPWGDTLGTNTLSGTGTGNTVAVPVYGRVPVQTTPTPGIYTDTVVVTVNY